MALSEDLINFDLIEGHKENIQQLPGGRSAKQLASILSPLPTARSGALPSLDETKNLNDALRQEYESELLSIADSDDPLDIYDRYVKWTFNAYPSAQATPQSQLLPLLERATKTFLTSSHYKNDPRYLKLWLHYIRLFDNTPRETFAFLARHHIGEGLGLFYEEFAAWLEGAGRWNQADEVYKLGIEREARPAERLMRKYNQFQQRYEARPQQGDDEPSSPALPTVRPALAAKIDPFAVRPEDSPATRPGSGGNATKPKSGKVKMAIFSDASSEVPPPATAGTQGWDSIGSMKERKKENTIEARPWTGETLKAGKRIGTVPKMEIFKDSKPQVDEFKKIPSKPTDVVNARTGRTERVFVNLESVYPNGGQEMSFEELRAMSRGWMNKDWTPVAISPMRPSFGNVISPRRSLKSMETVDVENLEQSFQSKIGIDDTSSQSMVDITEQKPAKQKRLKVREVKQETQTVKARLDSPTGPKIKRKHSAEPTMTFHSKAATNEIYDIFNQPSNKAETKEDTQSGDETDYGDDTYSIAGESVGTGRVSANNSEFGDDTTRSFGLETPNIQAENDSPWSDLTANNVSSIKDSKTKHEHRQMDSEELTEDFNSSQNHTMNTGAFDTQAIAAIANQNFGDMDTKMIAQLAGEEDEMDHKEEQQSDEQRECQDQGEIDDNLKTPIEGVFVDSEQFEVQQEPKFVPIPPEGYEPTPIRPFRDPSAVAHNKLPFMTPIVERTESSLAPSTVFPDPDYFTTKTPSRSVGASVNHAESPSMIQMGDLLLSSPHEQSPSPAKRGRSTSLLEVNEDLESSPCKKQLIDSPSKENQNISFSVGAPADAAQKVEALKDNGDVFRTPALPEAALAKPQPVPKGPIILDLQCNPCDPAIQQQILNAVHPPTSSYAGFIERSDMIFNYHTQLKSFAKKEKMVKSSPRKTNDRTLTKAVPPIMKFSGTRRVYALKKELGKGAYAPVYLVDSYDPAVIDDPLERDLDSPNKRQPNGTYRGALEAMKTESPPVSLTWEFYILRLVKSRLGSSARSMKSIVTAHECHLYRDECYLILDYHSQGTVLDLVNLIRTDSSRAGKTVEGLEEVVAMWLSVELLRVMDDFHKVGVLHGDLKADNCLVRFEPGELTVSYNRHGHDGWDSKGMMLIDFGRGIDTKAFKPEARFVADWAAEETDCAEIREARPWKWELDLFGAAGIIHSLLFGKYIETVAVSGGGGLGQKKEWKLKENFKRYWEKEIWAEVFHVLINGGSKKEEDTRREVVRVRGLMEDWLENEGERSGRDLRAAIRRCERLIGVAPGGRGKGR